MLCVILNSGEEIIDEDTECCVVEIPDAIKGSKIIAALTKEVDKKTMNKALSGSLPNIALPKEYVVIEEFPKMGSGKIDFRTTTDQVIEMIQAAA